MFNQRLVLVGTYVMCKKKSTICPTPRTHMGHREAKERRAGARNIRSGASWETKNCKTIPLQTGLVLTWTFIRYINLCPLGVS